MLAFVPFNHLELENGNSCFHTAKSLLFFFASHSNTQSSEAWKRPVKQKLDQAGQCKRVIISYSCALSELFMFSNENGDQKGSQKNMSDKLVIIY